MPESVEANVRVRGDFPGEQTSRVRTSRPLASTRAQVGLLGRIVGRLAGASFVLRQVSTTTLPSDATTPVAPTTTASDRRPRETEVGFRLCCVSPMRERGWRSEATAESNTARQLQKRAPQVGRSRLFDARHLVDDPRDRLNGKIERLSQHRLQPLEPGSPSPSVERESQRRPGQRNAGRRTQKRQEVD